MIDASIIVCTYNRAESLRDTLAALRKLQEPHGVTWEALIVDNNSKDHTRDVVEEAMRDWPRLRYEFEGLQGLSHARNRGIACSKGEIILFTDDDVLPESEWLERTLTGLNKYGAVACGGWIGPIWESPPPAWLTERFHGFLAIRADRSDDYQINDGGAAPYGANMAFRRTVFEQFGVFDTERGRKGNILASGEDGELFERLLKSGSRVVFLGDSRVHHKVEAFRLRKSYFRRWRLHTSRNLAQRRALEGNRRLFNIPLYLFPQTLRAVWRMIWGHLALPRDEAFHREIIVCHFLGVIQGLYRSR